jgi:hypothetical protein
MFVSAAGGLPRYFDHERSADKRLVKIAHFPELFGSFTPVCIVLQRGWKKQYSLQQGFPIPESGTFITYTEQF